MATTSDSNEADLEFRNEVIDKLLDSVDCTKYLKDSFGQFLGNITVNTNHKQLAFHLFCTVTLYISKQTTLDQEQMSVLCRIIGKLRQEWSDGDASSEHSIAPSYTENNVVCPKRSASSGSTTLPCAEVDDAMASTAKGAVGDDIGSVCETLKHTNIACPSTPENFVRGAEKHIPGTSNFDQAINSKDVDDLKSQYPFGYRLMAKQGWSDSSGLGPNGTGIRRPIHTDTSTGVFRDRDSPLGLGYLPKASSNIIVDGSRPENAEQTKRFTSTATTWHQYVAEYLTRGGTAETNDQSDHATNLMRPTRLAHKASTQTQTIPSSTGNSKTKIIVQDECVINDVWKDTSKYACAPRAGKNESRGILGKMGITHSAKHRDSEGW
ncbi:hypothetical protein GGR58DRAFT_471185 [Xylaria digitata]|nr:hypothetical protein GGR58DRAFT_471185 [Xylaria digitata]